MKLAMWVFMLVCNLLAPATIIGVGWLFKINPPKEISSTFGYRTKRSMKNQDTWDFAQLYSGKVCWTWGWVMVFPVVLGQALTLLRPTVESMCNWSLVVTAAEIVALVAIIFPVERALKRNFDKDGKRLCKTP